jgi:hypothetical protein
VTTTNRRTSRSRASQGWWLAVSLCAFVASEAGCRMHVYVYQTDDHEIVCERGNGRRIDCKIDRILRGDNQCGPFFMCSSGICVPVPELGTFQCSVGIRPTSSGPTEAEGRALQLLGQSEPMSTERGASPKSMAHTVREFSP